MQKLCESKAPKDRSDAGRKSEKRRECDAERASARDDQNLDGGHAYVSQPGIHIHVNQTQNSQLPAPQEASTAQPIPELPSPSHHSSQRSTVPAMHSKLTRPWSPHDHTSIERPRQPSRQTHRSRSRSRTSQAPDELPGTLFHRARESDENRPRRATAQQVSRPHEEAPSTRTASRQWRHIPAPSEHVHFASPPRSESMAGEERPRQAAENVREFSSQYRQPRRERSSYSAQGSQSRRAYTHAPESWSEDRGGTGRYVGEKLRFRDV